MAQTYAAAQLPVRPQVRRFDQLTGTLIACQLYTLCKTLECVICAAYRTSPVLFCSRSCPTCGLANTVGCLTLRTHAPSLRRPHTAHPFALYLHLAAQSAAMRPCNGSSATTPAAQQPVHLLLWLWMPQPAAPPSACHLWRPGTATSVFKYRCAISWHMSWLQHSSTGGPLVLL